MTRVKFFAASTCEKLEAAMNAWIEQMETDGSGVKALEYRVDLTSTPAFPVIYTAMVVYGNGPHTTQRWSGRIG